MQKSLLSFYSTSPEPSPKKCTRRSPRKPTQIVIPDDTSPTKKNPLKVKEGTDGNKCRPGPKSKTRISPVKKKPVPESSDEESLPDLCIEIENPVAALAAAVDQEPESPTKPRWDPFTDQLVTGKCWALARGLQVESLAVWCAPLLGGSKTHRCRYALYAQLNGIALYAFLKLNLALLKSKPVIFRN